MHGMTFLSKKTWLMHYWIVLNIIALPLQLRGQAYALTSMIEALHLKKQAER